MERNRDLDSSQDPSTLEPGMYLSADWSMPFLAGVLVGCAIGELVAWLMLRVGG